MKFTLFALAALSVANAASVGPIKNAKAVSDILGKARRLADNAEQQEQDMYAFLNDYSLKFLGCKSGEQWTDPEDGTVEYSVAIFRLCHSDSGCNSDSSKGCKSGYGDYIVGLNSFTEAYMEDQRDNLQNDNYDLMELTQCRELQAQNGGRKLEEQQAMYFVGPACTSDGSDIKLEVYSDEYCSEVADNGASVFYNMAGFELPYSDGGLATSQCYGCYGANDNGGYELFDFCLRNYEKAYGSGCETNMNSYSSNGKDESACESISKLTASKKSSGAGWKIFLVILIIACCGIGGYFYYQKMKKRATGVGGSVNSAGLMS